MTPGESVSKYCRTCVQGDRRAVKGCGGDKAILGSCVFFPYRLGEKRISVRVFRQFCLQCMCGDRKAVKDCSTFDCECWQYRMGKNPAKTGQGNLENFTKGKKETLLGEYIRAIDRLV